MTKLPKFSIPVSICANFVKSKSLHHEQIQQKSSRGGFWFLRGEQAATCVMRIVRHVSHLRMRLICLPPFPGKSAKRWCLNLASIDRGTRAKSLSAKPTSCAERAGNPACTRSYLWDFSRQRHSTTGWPWQNENISESQPEKKKSMTNTTPAMQFGLLLLFILISCPVDSILDY